MALNKAQINYFSERANIIKKRLKEKHDEAFIRQDGYSTEQMVSMISSGRARFKEEIFQGGSCPRLSMDSSKALGTLFEFPGEAEIQSKNERRDEIIKQVCDRITSHMEHMKDDFVMGEIQDPRQALRDLENTGFFKSRELEVLRDIAVPNEESELITVEEEGMDP